jgi:ferric-dicitrate binding protein FerR (iron transport regulator)
MAHETKPASPPPLPDHRDRVIAAARALEQAWNRYARTFSSVHCDSEGASWQDWQSERSAHDDAMHALRAALRLLDAPERDAHAPAASPADGATTEVKP